MSFNHEYNIYPLIFIFCFMTLSPYILNVNILNLMSKYPSSTRRVSVKKDGISKASKENVDTIYLIQNEN